MFILLVFGPLYVPQLRELMRARRAYKNGEIPRAKIVFVKKRVQTTWPGWPGSSSSDVFVRYPSVAGHNREATAFCQNDWLIAQLAPGATVHIAYLESEPTHAVLLENYLR